MKKSTLLLIAFALISCANSSAKNKDRKDKAQQQSFVVSKLEKLSGGFSFTEGPAVDAQGNVYFTDPKYGAGDTDLTQDGMHVYYITPDHTSVIRVCDNLEKPNGLIGAPDGKILYVTDTQAGKTYKYDIQEDGTLIN